MTKLVLKNDHQNDTYHNEIGLCAHNINTIMDLLVDTLERVYVVVKNER